VHAPREEKNDDSKTVFMRNYITFSVISLSKLKVNHSHYRPEVRRGFQEVKVPRLRDNGRGWW